LSAKNPVNRRSTGLRAKLSTTYAIFFQGTKVKLTLYFFSMPGKKKNAEKIRQNRICKKGRRPGVPAAMKV